ncbi:hypothetical protein R3P38DRAFT_2770491 [Favolaschia claudopus]|uniref:Uncharacterized protein n=1 Tax=Favolaschia claudopus TaxID=2862362 RepID=A0AAW0CIJ1_9AGAR
MAMASREGGNPSCSLIVNLPGAELIPRTWVNLSCGIQPLPWHASIVRTVGLRTSVFWRFHKESAEDSGPVSKNVPSGPSSESLEEQSYIRPNIKSDPLARQDYRPTALYFYVGRKRESSILPKPTAFNTPLKE